VRVIRVERAREHDEITDAGIGRQHGRQRDRRTSAAATLIEDVCDRLCREGLPLAGLGNGRVELGRAVLVEQVEQARGRALYVPKQP
jgi:hypothetical protein